MMVKAQSRDGNEARSTNRRLSFYAFHRSSQITQKCAESVPGMIFRMNFFLPRSLFFAARENGEMHQVPFPRQSEKRSGHH